MTQNDKDLLLKDLCARLPYGVKMNCPDGYGGYISMLEDIDICGYVRDAEGEIHNIEQVKPYLFPLTSMTAEQRTSHNFLKHSAYANPVKLIDWYIKNHFDYRGLIPKGLANDATNKNIY